MGATTAADHTALHPGLAAPDDAERSDLVVPLLERSLHVPGDEDALDTKDRGGSWSYWF
ncbi:MAG: hypothetical protein ACRD0P_15030 [Stackebrandtia sp.]